ncbi:MAG: NUDIX domain-containing protein [Geminicoccaceae bacterium]
MSGERPGRRFRVLDRRRVHEGFYQLDVLELQHERFDGGWTGPLRRELLVQRRAVAVLPYDPEQDLVVLVEQFRTGCIDQAAGEPWLIEAVAGLVEDGETAEQVAEREVREETGLAIGRLEHACRYHASPGGTSEQVQVFVAEIQAGAAGGVHGVAHEDEDIRTHVLPAEQAFAMVADGRIIAANGVIPILWLQLHRERLRRAWARAAV